MRLVQKAAMAPDQPVHLTASQDSHLGCSAGFEEAPWMGQGGVRHMDAGHVGQ